MISNEYRKRLETIWKIAIWYPLKVNLSRDVRRLWQCFFNNTMSQHIAFVDEYFRIILVTTTDFCMVPHFNILKFVSIPSENVLSWTCEYLSLAVQEILCYRRFIVYGLNTRFWSSRIIVEWYHLQLVKRMFRLLDKILFELAILSWFL